MSEAILDSTPESTSAIRPEKPRGMDALRNILTIAKREVTGYFASPIAYLLMAIFAVIFGFFFYSATAFFVMRGMESQMMGRSMPMDVNEWVIRPLLSAYRMTMRWFSLSSRNVFSSAK